MPIRALKAPESFWGLHCYDPLQPLSWWKARAVDNNANVLSVHCNTAPRFSELNSFQFLHPKCVTSTVPPSCQLLTRQSAMVSVPKILFTWLNFTIIGHMVFNLPCTLIPLPFTCQNPKSPGLTAPTLQDLLQPIRSHHLFVQIHVAHRNPITMNQKLKQSLHVSRDLR